MGVGWGPGSPVPAGASSSPQRGGVSVSGLSRSRAGDGGIAPGTSLLRVPKTPLVGGPWAVPGSLGPHCHVLSRGGCSPPPRSLPCWCHAAVGTPGHRPMARGDGLGRDRGHPCRGPGRNGPQRHPDPVPPPAVAPPPLPGAVPGAPGGVCSGPRRGARARDGARGPHGNGGAVARSCSVSRVETCQGCHVINTR